jgi:hypothetical protein
MLLRYCPWIRIEGECMFNLDGFGVETRRVLLVLEKSV